MSELPPEYKWLDNLKGKPRTIIEGLKLLGTQEVVGRGSNRTIIGWRDELNQNGVKIVGFSDDDVPWCGLLAAFVVFRRVKNAIEVVKNPLWARSWVKFGVRAKQAMLGDILVFERGPDSGHVGFYVGEDDKCYHVLGGNQKNAVTITRILKKRCIAIRRPAYVKTPAAVRPFYLSSGGEISTNEA